METPTIIGNKTSNLLFKKIYIYNDRLETKNWLLPKKIIWFKEVLSCREINRKIKNTNIVLQELIIYSSKAKYTIESCFWHNYSEMKDFLVKGNDIETKKESEITIAIER